MGTDELLFSRLRNLSGLRTLIVGIGNSLKGDDGAGPLLCQQLKDGTSAELIDAGTVPENYIQRIIKKSPQNLIIIDAVDFGASAGTIELFRPEQLASLVISTHTLSHHLFIDMIKKAIETEVYFIGIQPAQTQLAQRISAEVSQAVGKLTCTLAELFPPGK
jgi:hydrogenase 3 maturation protease